MAIILISQGFRGVNFRRKPHVYKCSRLFAGPTIYDSGYFTHDIYLTPEQFAELQNFIDNASSGGFGNDDYNALWNSCVDYVWAALEAAGLNPKSFQGDIFPWFNIDDIKKIPLNPKINNDFGNARTPVRKDPLALALDLDGDGIETIGVTATTQVLFDFDADGIKTGTGWVKSDDALLVLDKNANGTIDNGNELFGVDTVLVNGPNAGQTAANGFAALADLDSNHDGQFSNLDSQYAQVQIWRDLNQDGISQTGELQTLTQAGIASISLTSTASNNNLGNGNVISAVGTYTKTNGQTGTTGTAVIDKAANLDLASNPFYRVFTDPIPLTAEAAKLPGMQGAGAVRDLKEAASLNAALITDFNALAGTTRSQMLAQLDTLIQHWADTSTMKTSQEKAAEQGYTLIFSVPGATSNELLVQEAANNSNWQRLA